ncbi:MAG: LysR family transcriptional regulator [Xanthobacteraceae bacterium]
MDFRQLRYFVAVARAQSFSGASRRLHVSQPALCYQIKHLEQALKVDLFARHARGVTLTGAGARLLEEAEDILDRLHRAEQAVVPFRKKLAGELALGVTPTSGRVLVPDLLAACAQSAALKVTIHQGMSEDLLRRIEEGTLDLAFCYQTDGLKRANCVELYREPLCLVGSPDIVGSTKPLAFDQLARFPLVLDDKSHVMRRMTERVARERSVKLDVALEIEPINLKREMIVRRRFCTVVPYGLFLEEIRGGQLAARRITNPRLMQSLHLIGRRNLNRAVYAFMLGLVRDIVAARIGDGQLGWQEPGSSRTRIARQAVPSTVRSASAASRVRRYGGR